MTLATAERTGPDTNCPPPPPPPPTKYAARLERAIEVACQAPPFPEEVLVALRDLLPPVRRTK
jgi:hypothetical protein